ncbi:MAG TPA: TIGR00296 family protein, partial [Candidatus Bathyarchaeia archaeon]|nr:TIGR00296 family protein [Candidatus Bathyarchaeia archaeon]
MISLLSTEDGTTLVRTARQAIADHLDGKNFDSVANASSELRTRRGVFVTLFDKARSRRLRGCIGNPFPKTSLLNETVRCAVDAATMDPRFVPVRKDEFLQSIAVEVTVLAPLEHIVVKNPLDLTLNIKVGRDGLFVEGFGTRGLLLPQVAVDEGFDEEEFLNECCLKAGLMPDAWVTGSVKVARFQGQIFSEDEPGGRVF